jgi:hypothetical protein
MTRRFAPSAICLAIVAATLMIPAVAAGQGRGRPKTPKAPTTSPATTAGSTTTGSTSSSSPSPLQAAPAVTTYRQFGSWLDDASAPVRGEGFASIGMGHWRMDGVSQTNVPMVAAGIGVTDRMQVSASVPFYRAQFQGTSSQGIDDVYLSAKYSLIDPTLTVNEFGLAVSPAIEVLSAGTSGRRLHLALPVSMEVRRLPFRVYASAGYFTRGSVFSGGAVEWTSPGNLVLSAALTQSYSVKQDAVLDSLSISRQRVDVTGSLAYPVTDVIGVSMSLGRSLTSIAEGGTSLALAGGVSFRFAGAR